MKVTLQKQEKNKIFLEIELEAKRVSDTYEKRFRETAKTVSVPGFRKGKAPRKMIEKYIYSDMLRKDVLEELVSSSYPEALKQLENPIEPIAQPEVEISKFELDQEFIYKATIEVRPEIKLGEYKGLTIEVDPISEIDDVAVEKEIEELRKSVAQLITVERPIQQDDVVLVDIYGEVEGEPIPDGATDNLQMEIKPGNFVEGFTEQLVGANTNERKAVEVTFPDSYAVTDLRQKQGKFEVLIKEIKELKLPELNDEFAKQMSSKWLNTDLNNIDELKVKVKEDLISRSKNDQLLKNQEALVEAIISAAEVEVPESMEKQEMYGLWQSREGMLLASRDVAQEVLDASWENWQSREDILLEARKRVKTTLVFSEISRKENVNLTTQELDSHLSIYSRIYQKSIEDVKLMLDDNGKLLPLIDNLLVGKILKWLEDNSTVTVKGQA
ncbi:MAG: trigger factor [Cyanobacteriota bacterium]